MAATDPDFFVTQLFTVRAPPPRYYEELKARDAGVTVDELRGPLLATAKKPENVPKVRGLRRAARWGTN